MSRKRLGRLQRAATIVPLALLSAAWTASVAGIGGLPSPVSAEGAAPGPAGDTSVPAQAIQAPASLSSPGSLDTLGAGGNDASIVATASTNEIPSAALAAYQRAESVINSADKSCHLSWQLIAAIGRVESNHGRADGNVLNDQGVSTPGVYGPVLDGKHHTKAVPDTDAGQYDNNTKWDRAVGPMQFIPSTWAVVGVDADGDGKRNPQDIDDASLATAVYLCSGTDDLSTLAGQRAAVLRYNHSNAYVDLVIKVMNAYLQGNYTSVPNNSTAAGYVVPGAPSYTGGGTFGGGHNTYHAAHAGAGLHSGTGGADHSGGSSASGGSTGSGSTGGSTGGSGLPSGGPTTAPPTNPVTKTVTGVVKGLGNTLKGITGGGSGSGSSGGSGSGSSSNPVSNVVNGLLGALNPVTAQLQCDTKYLLQPAKKEECLQSYGLG